MKHLKFFEEICNYKKYIVLAAGIKNYYVLEILRRINDKQFNIIVLYRMMKHTKGIEKVDAEPFDVSFSLTLQKDILFDTDNLQDAIDKMELYYDSDSYNL